MKAETITGVNELPLEEGEKKGKVEKKAGKRIGYNYIVVKSFKESQKNDVVKCLYIKSLTKWGFCVIKEGTFGDTKDKNGRDIRDRLIWQEKLHKQLQKKVRIPKLLGSFEENGNYYLVIELLAGKSLSGLIRKHEKTLRQELLFGGKIGVRFLDYLIQITDLISSLHKNGVVHRDATGGNFMIRKNGKVALIDLELSFSVTENFPSPPFELGTFGYMSPEQEAISVPGFEEDVFSIGALILHVFTGMSPAKLTHQPKDHMEARIGFLISEPGLSEMVIRILDTDPAKRPSISEIRNTLILYQNALKKRTGLKKITTSPFSRIDMTEILQEAIVTLGSPLMADPDKGWFAENHKLPQAPEKSKINKAWYGSFYNGAAGPIYFLSQAAKAGFDISPCRPAISRGLELIQNKYIKDVTSSSPGLYFGSSGIAMTYIESMKNGLIPFSEEYAGIIRNFLDKDNPHLDHLNGVAGQGLALLFFESLFNNGSTSVTSELIASNLLSEQLPGGAWLRGANDNGKRVHVSFAYGIAGIVFFLLEYYRRTQNTLVFAAIEAGLHCLISQSSTFSGALIWRKESRKRYTWWCSGEVGIAQTFIKAYEILRNPVYKSYATRTLLGYPENITENNFSQCHGLSSLGEVYLEAYKVFEEEVWLKRAGWIANLLLHVRKQHMEYGPWWQVEHERQPTAAFMTGNSGVLHFLLRFCYPDIASFPFETNHQFKWGNVALETGVNY